MDDRAKNMRVQRTSGYVHFYDVIFTVMCRVPALYSFVARATAKMRRVENPIVPKTVHRHIPETSMMALPNVGMVDAPSESSDGSNEVLEIVICRKELNEPRKLESFS